MIDQLLYLISQCVEHEALPGAEMVLDHTPCEPGPPRDFIGASSVVSLGQDAVDRGVDDALRRALLYGPSFRRGLNTGSPSGGVPAGNRINSQVHELSVPSSRTRNILVQAGSLQRHPLTPVHVSVGSWFGVAPGVPCESVSAM